MADLIIETVDLVKRFGKFTAVDGLSLEVPAGSIYGFLGPNGAGKTTTMRMLTTLTRPTSGSARVNGFSVTDDQIAVRRSIGYMPDEFGVYEDLRVWEYLDFFAACYDIAEGERKKLINDLLALVDLAHKREDMVDKLSRGMKQRLSLARTLAHDPAVLILDEPASGLDPRARIEIRELMVELARMGKTIFFSTHILADVENICSHIGIVEAGKLVMQGSMSELKARLMPHREIFVTVKDDTAAESARAIALTFGGVIAAEVLEPKGGRSRVRVDYQGDDDGVAALNQTLTTSGVAILGFQEEVQNLESVFMRVTHGIVG
ncbi:MAG: ABC transporter ATP-binding protein [Anaerolineae bacterium]|nr:MAG: ABC transporter-like protein [Chloroflexi bacterium OLB13]MBW7879920.1 ABC transporter ATP-binding protein [Anaerolineae bacterium]MEB2366199.1 ABC transporter ATP-binding protein [Chloroflexota bacterium]